MNAWSEWVAARTWRRVLLAVICLAPLLSGVVSRLAKGSHWFGDYEAITCAGQRLAAELPIYDIAPTCAGMQPTGYVYLPWVAQAFEAASAAIGADALRALYLAVHVASFGLLGWVAFFARQAPGTIWDRLPVLGLVTGSTIYWGNIAPPIHALIAAAALTAGRRPLLFALTLAAAATVKPVFLTYGIVLLTLPIAVWKRLGLGALAGAGLIPTILFVANGGEQVAAWSANIDHYVYRVQPGDGFLGWIHLLGGPPGMMAPWLVFAALLTAATILVAERGGLSTEGRIWLGMGAGALANPRIVPLDVLLLACLLGALVQVIRNADLDDRQKRWGAGIAIGSVIVGALGNSLDAGDYSPKIATLGLTAVLCGLAVLLAGRRHSPTTR